MSTPKRHHYVPRVILEKFTDAEGWLHIFSRIAAANDVMRTKVENAFVKKHLYSQIERDGSKDPTIEFEFSKLESRVAPALQKVVQAVRSERLPQLSDVEREDLATLFLMQWKRVPEAMFSDDMVAAAEEQFVVIGEELKARLPDRVEEIEALQTPEAKAQILWNAGVQSVAGDMPQAMSVMKERGLAFLGIRVPNKSFVIGSQPVVKLNFRKGLTLANNSTEMWLPIASDVAMGVGFGSEPESLHFLDGPEPIRHLNKAVASQSQTFASHSLSLTRSLIKPT